MYISTHRTSVIHSLCFSFSLPLSLIHMHTHTHTHTHAGMCYLASLKLKRYVLRADLAALDDLSTLQHFGKAALHGQVRFVGLAGSHVVTDDAWALKIFSRLPAVVKLAPALPLDEVVSLALDTTEKKIVLMLANKDPFWQLIRNS